MAIIDKTGRAAGRPRKPASPPRRTLTADEEKAELIGLVTRAKRSDRIAFGRADHRRIVTAIFPQLSVVQIAWIRDGVFGQAMAHAVARLGPDSKRRGPGIERSLIVPMLDPD
jgi:hypothetical protein